MNIYMQLVFRCLLEFKLAARLDFFERLNISDANWAVSDKQEACSALLPGASGEGGWKDCDLNSPSFMPTNV